MAHDLERLTPDHVAWLQSLPAIALEGETLIVHADSDMYLRYGRSVDAVNAAFRAAISGDDTAALYRLVVDCDRPARVRGPDRGRWPCSRHSAAAGSCTVTRRSRSCWIDPPPR